MFRLHPPPNGSVSHYHPPTFFSLSLSPRGTYIRRGLEYLHRSLRIVRDALEDPQCPVGHPVPVGYKYGNLAPQDRQGGAKGQRRPFRGAEATSKDAIEGVQSVGLMTYGARLQPVDRDMRRQAQLIFQFNLYLRSFSRALQRTAGREGFHKRYAQTLLVWSKQRKEVSRGSSGGIVTTLPAEWLRNLVQFQDWKDIFFFTVVIPALGPIQPPVP
jgi:hypothetical protein